MSKMPPTLELISTGIVAFEKLLTIGAALAMAAIMLVIVCAVTMRYVFVSPLGWSYDLIGVYLMVGVFFFSLSDTLNHHGHISIDIFQDLIPFRLSQAALAIGYAAAVLVMGLIVWQAWLRLESAWTFGDRLGSSTAWPTWPSYLLVVLGTSVMTLRTALQCVGHCLSAVAGRLLIGMPPPPITSNAKDKETE